MQGEAIPKLTMWHRPWVGLVGDIAEPYKRAKDILKNADYRLA